MHFDGRGLIQFKGRCIMDTLTPFPQRPLLGSDPQLAFERLVLGGP